MDERTNLNATKNGENENSAIKEKKKIDWRSIGKKAAVFVGGLIVGITAFCLVGVAMACTTDSGEDTIESDDGDIIPDQNTEDSDSGNDKSSDAIEIYNF